MAIKKSIPNKQSTNVFVIIGFILSFLIPLVGLILSIVGLSQIKKTKQKGHGLAIAGIILSIVFMFFQILFFFIVLATLFSSPTLVPYRNNEIGYSINYPKDWQIVDESDKNVKGILFKDEVDSSGKVRGQVEVIYTAPPPNGYKSDVLSAIKDSFVTNNKITITSQSTGDVKGAKALRFSGYYNGQNGKIKVQGVIMLNKDNSTYTIVAQAPEENWNRLQSTYNEIENSFNP
jgi:hypothetical protein